MKRTLIIFAKEPQLGKVKTRMSGCLSDYRCLGLCKALLRDSLNIARKVKAAKKILAYDTNKRKASYLIRVGKGFILYKQDGMDLGQKMYNAFLYAKDITSSKTIIIGSDSPTLPISYIEAAFRLLDKKDVVLGPALDGGYYLIGLTNPCYGLFKGIKWSTDTVLKETIRRARELNKSVAMLKTLHDIDEHKDLILLRSTLKKKKRKVKAIWTRRFLKI